MRYYEPVFSVLFLIGSPDRSDLLNDEIRNKEKFHGTRRANRLTPLAIGNKSRV